MKRFGYSDYNLASVILVGMAGVLLLAVMVTNRGDITSATLVLAGVSCFIAGIVLFTFSKEEPIDPRVSALLPVPGTLAFSRLCADLGVQGNARLIPIGEEIWQFVPVNDGMEIPESSTIGQDFSFLTGEGHAGVLVHPSGIPLLELLSKEHSFVIPREEVQIDEAVREVFEDVLELADRVVVQRTEGSCLITLQGFRLFRGCTVVQSASPKCCTMAPCPVCSLAACIIAKGLSTTLVIEQAVLDPGARSVRLVVSFNDAGP